MPTTLDQSAVDAMFDRMEMTRDEANAVAELIRSALRAAGAPHLCVSPAPFGEVGWTVHVAPWMVLSDADSRGL